MINLEIVITLVAMLVAFFIVLFLLQKGNARKKRIRQDVETLELAKQLKCDTRDSENLSTLGLRPFHVKAEKASAIESECRSVITFGFVIFTAYLIWSIFLMGKGLVEIAALSMVFALSCVLLLVYAKRNIIKGKAALEQLRSDVDEYEQGIGRAPAKQQIKQVIPKAPVYGKPVDELYALARDYPCVPQDATLKRHFLSNLWAEIEAGLPPRPTDSMLKRHYDTMVLTAFNQRLQTLSEPEAVKVSHVVGKKQSAIHSVVSSFIPEDSMLRRHFLTQLRNQIESGFGTRPTDSTLKRHYDSMVNTELERQIDALQTQNMQHISKRDQTYVVERVDSANRAQTSLPEDATLRRHFLSQLRNKIEAKLTPRPTDFNLLRHYKSLVQAKLERMLDERYS